MDLCRVSVEPADFPVWEGTGNDDATFWWRFPIVGTGACETARAIER